MSEWRPLGAATPTRSWGHVARLEGLEGLSIDARAELTDAGLAHLRGMAGLTRLTLRSQGKITGTGLANLSGLRRLERLDLSRLRTVNDADLVHLAGLSSVRLSRWTPRLSPTPACAT